MLKKMIVLICIVAFMTVTYGCATHPRHIGASHVNSSVYKRMSCDDIFDERESVVSRLNVLIPAQKKKSDSDTIAFWISMLLFWPAIFFLGMGDDHKEEISRLRGELIAIDRAAKSCERKTDG